MKMALRTWLLAGLICFGIALDAGATAPHHCIPTIPTFSWLTGQGSIDAVGEGSAKHPEAVSVDYWVLTMESRGFVAIDLLAWGMDLDGDRKKTFLDPEIYLFGDNPFEILDDRFDVPLRHGDDNWMGWDTDGSKSKLDSFMLAALDKGKYLLAISSFNFEVTEAMKGINRAPSEKKAHLSTGDYQVTVLGFGLGNLVQLPIPEPGTGLLLGFGVLGLAFHQGRRRC